MNLLLWSRSGQMVMASWLNKNFTILLSVNGAFYKNFSEEAEWELVLWEMQDRQASASKIVNDNLKKYLFGWTGSWLQPAGALIWIPCGVWDLFHCSMQILCCGIWDLVPRPGIEPVPPVTELGVLSTEPPGKSLNNNFKISAHFYSATLSFFTRSIITLILSSLLIWGKEIWVDWIYTKRLLLDTRTFWPNGC